MLPFQFSPPPVGERQDCRDCFPVNAGCSLAQSPILSSRVHVVGSFAQFLSAQVVKYQQDETTTVQRPRFALVKSLRSSFLITGALAHAPFCLVRKMLEIDT